MLFLANLIGITLSASVVFLSQRYGHWHQAGGHLIAVADSVGGDQRTAERLDGWISSGTAG